MSVDIVTLALSKAYTNKTIIGATGPITDIQNLKTTVDAYTTQQAFSDRLKTTLVAGTGISISPDCVVSTSISASGKIYEIVQDNLSVTAPSADLIYLVTGIDDSQPVMQYVYVSGDPSNSASWLHVGNLPITISNYSTTAEMNTAINAALVSELGDLETNSNITAVLASKGFVVASDVNTALNTKADKATTYTKTETDSAIASAVSAIPEPPTALSQLTNDSGYAVQSQVDSEIATSVGSLSNNASQVKIRFTNLTTGTTGFSANTPIILSIRSATASIVPFPISVWDRNSIKNAINTYELGFFVQGADESGDRLREANISQSTRWRVAGNYTGKDPSTLGRLRCFISNPDTGFRASSAVIVPSSITDDDFTFEFTTIADSGSMSQGSGYQIGFETSFDDPGLTVSVNSIVRIGEAMENAII